MAEDIPGYPGAASNIGGRTSALPSIKDDADFAKLAPGAEFTDPAGQTRRKPWVVTDDRSFEAVPEGMPFKDPTGQLRTKPAYEPIGIGTQILYDMAANEKERSNILAGAYGADAVKRSPKGDYYVTQPGGKFLKPGRGFPGVAGFIASEAAPVAGSVAGEIAGGTAGSIVPGAGTLGGAVLGGAGGAAAGTAFNDMILGLAGVYDRSVGEEAGGLGLSAGLGAAGTAIGRGISAISPSIKSAMQSGKGLVDKIKDILPSQVAYITGASVDPEATRTAARLSSEGTLVRPSAWMKEAPYLKKVVEEFDPVFRQQDVLHQSAMQRYEQEAGRLLDTVGVTATGREPLTAATKPVSSLQVGEAMLKRIHADVAAEDAKLDASIKALRGAAETAGYGQAAAHESRLSLVNAATESSLRSAQEAIDAGFGELRGDVSTAMRAVNADRHPGDLWRRAGEKLDMVHAGIDARAGRMYQSAYQTAGEAPLATHGVQDEARRLIETLPLEFQSSFPTMVHQLDRFRGNEPMTLEWAHNLRSLARSRVDRMIPYADRAEGINRKIAGMVNRMLHDPAQPPEIQAAVGILDRTDAFYSKNMSKFEQEAVDKIVKKMRSGNIDDASALAKIAFDKDSTVGRDTIRKLLGPQLWKAVHAADVQGLLANSADSLGGIDASRFANQVAARLRDGVWDAADVPEKTARLANQILASEGKIPLQALPGDSVGTLLQRAADYQAESKLLAQERPLETLADELKRLDSEHRRTVAAARTARKQAPLGFMTEPQASIRVMDSADRILGDPDLMIAAAQRFGPNSSEFEMLRKVYAHRLLQRESGATGRLGRELRDIPESVQRMVFPGATRDELQTLARDMTFLLGGTGETMGGSLAAMSRVLNPTGSIVGLPFLRHTHFPGVDPVARFILAKYYQLVTTAVTNPGFIQWVAKGLNGPASTRTQTAAAVQKAMGWGGPIGAGVGAALPGLGTRGSEKPPTAAQPRRNWRDIPTPQGRRAWQHSDAEQMRRAAGVSR